MRGGGGGGMMCCEERDAHRRRHATQPSRWHQAAVRTRSVTDAGCAIAGCIAGERTGRSRPTGRSRGRMAHQSPIPAWLFSQSARRRAGSHAEKHPLPACTIACLVSPPAWPARGLIAVNTAGGAGRVQRAWAAIGHRNTQRGALPAVRHRRAVCWFTWYGLAMVCAAQPVVALRCVDLAACAAGGAFDPPPRRSLCARVRCLAAVCANSRHAVPTPHKRVRSLFRGTWRAACACATATVLHG
jgi:hypothetical protein